jgi:cobalt/nickel transport system permease protein
MHLHEAVLSGSPQGIGVLCLGGVGALAGTALGLRAMDHDQVPRVALVSAVFFVVSLIHIPLGVTSIHLTLNGLVGLLLGWTAFPALLIALLLQAVLCGHGGLLALGFNTLAMALPAVAVYYLFQRTSHSSNRTTHFLAGFGAGSLAILGSAFLMSAALWVSGESFELAAKAVFSFHLAVAVIEGLVVGSAIVFLRQVCPERLHLTTPQGIHDRG